MIKYIGLGALVLVGGLLAAAAMQPAEFAITRSATVAASPAVVYDQLDDFTAWNAWSPWVELDPDQKVEMSGPESGVGASYSWNGNEKVGNGSMTITEVRPGEWVAMDLKFITPWEAQNITTFALSPEGEGTKVVWTMSGTNDFMGKLMSLFMDMDAMVGPDFERGLAKLDTVSQTAQAAANAAAEAAAAEAAAAEAAAAAAVAGEVAPAE